MDNTFNNIREKSFQQWLSDMERHEDVAVRGGVRLARDYMEYLQGQIRLLEEKNALKDAYLKKLKEEKK